MYCVFANFYSYDNEYVKYFTLASRCFREQYDGIMAELERAKKSLNAKESVEKTQIETINQLTKNRQKSEKQLTSSQSQIDNLTSTLITLQRYIKRNLFGFMHDSNPLRNVDKIKVHVISLSLSIYLSLSPLRTVYNLYIYVFYR